MARRFASVSIDLDSLWCYHEIHGLEPCESEKEDIIHQFAMPRIFDFFSSLDIPLTLFVIGKDVRRHRRFLLEASRLGYELANHTFSHTYGLRDLSKQDIREDIKRGHEAIGELSSTAPVGFRTPGYNISTTIMSILAELGYAYDSSVFPCPPYYMAKGAVMGWRKLSGGKSRSSMALPQTLIAPTAPYVASPRAFWKRSAEATKTPVEIPICTLPGLRFPIIGTSLHLLNAPTFKVLYPTLKLAHPDLINLEFHAIDFVDAQDLDHPRLVEHQPDLAISWEKKKERYSEILRVIGKDYNYLTLKDANLALDLRHDFLQ